MEVPDKAPVRGMEWSGSHFYGYRSTPDEGGGTLERVKVPRWMQASIERAIEKAYQRGDAHARRQISDSLRY